MKTLASLVFAILGFIFITLFNFNSSIDVNATHSKINTKDIKEQAIDHKNSIKEIHLKLEKITDYIIKKR